MAALKGSCCFFSLSIIWSNSSLAHGTLQPEVKARWHQLAWLLNFTSVLADYEHCNQELTSARSLHCLRVS